MKQVLQSLRNGETTVANVPCPAAAPGALLIGSSVSLISAGTERMLVDFGRSSLIDKVRQQPDKVRQVLEKMRTDGVVATLEAVQSKLDQPLALGYCNVGRVLEVGAGVEGFAVGERVVSNGKHAEAVVVPKNLCARIPDGVDDESAAFTVLGAIALQGIRLIQPTLGEVVVVSGLGLIGLMAVQILRANGCRVLGVDMDAGRLALARQFGAECVDLSRGEDPVAAAMAFSRGRGVDAVLLTASTSSSEPVAQAAHMCRKRGRIVLVGVTGLELSRADFYEKELSFQVSCSYGPGRYDPAYEDKGQDYPVGYVRWTEQRNFEAVLDLMASGALDVKPLVSHRYTVDEAGKAYDLLASGAPSLGILLRYPEREGEAASRLRARTVSLAAAGPASAAVPKPATDIATILGVIGAGNYAGRVLIPAFKRAGATLHTLVSAGGVSAAYHGGKQGFEQASTEAASVLADPAIGTVVVATRHDSHAGYVCRALESGKHVFVEKPLAVSEDQVAEIEARLARTSHLLMVGFNRRFAPQVVKMHELLGGIREPKAFVMTVNAGAIPAEHWTQDAEAGGGRIVGEACHFIDLLRHLAGAPITSQHVAAIRGGTGPVDRVTITLGFADGSIGTLHYLSNGHRAFPKERLEVFAAGRVLQLDNFRRLKAYGWPGFSSMNLWRQDKGQNACAKAFMDAVRAGGPSPIPPDELLEVARVTIAVARAAQA
jgi:predicted dehydrogenase/threonine dehydrogenase-like Zn-dependent dehydrogenase